MYVTSGRDLAAGDPLTLAFPFSELAPAPFVLRGQVARRGDVTSNFGVRFDDTRTGHLERLRMWVDLFHYFEKTKQPLNASS